MSVLNQVHESMAPEDRKNQLKIEAAIDTFCGQRLSSRDDKMVREQNGGLDRTLVLFGTWREERYHRNINGDYGMGHTKRPVMAGAAG